MSDAGQPDGLIQWAIGVLLGTVGGAFGTVVALRTKLTSMQRDIAEESAARKRGDDEAKREIVNAFARLDQAESEIMQRIDRLDKRQLAMLRLTADVARKVEVDGRAFDDALVRMLTDDHNA